MYCMYDILSLSLVPQNTVLGTGGPAGGFWSVYHRYAGEGQPLHHPCPPCHHHAARHQVGAAHHGRLMMLHHSSLPPIALATLGKKRGGQHFNSFPQLFFLHKFVYCAVAAVAILGWTLWKVKVKIFNTYNVWLEHFGLGLLLLGWGCLGKPCTCPHSHSVPAMYWNTCVWMCAKLGALRWWA